MTKTNSGQTSIDKRELIIFISFIFLLFVYLLLIRYSPNFLFINDNFFSKGIRIISDYFDRAFYSAYGEWTKLKYFPYNNQEFSDLPPVAIYFFGLNWLFSQNLKEYMFIFSLSMMFVSSLAFIIFLKKLSGAGKSSWQIIIWFTPISFYYYLNRFDMLPVFFFIASLDLIKNRKFTPGGMLYGCSILTKWFTAITFVCLLIYIYNNRKKKNDVLKFVSGIILVIFSISVFTIITSGLKGFLLPYKNQIFRINFESLYYLLNLHQSKTDFFRYVFAFLQIIPALILPFLKSSCDENKFNAMIAVIIINFIIFCPVNSPQWFQWFFPFALLALKMKKWIILFLIIQIITYLNFPVFFDIYGPYSNIFKYTVSAKIFSYIAIEGVLLLKIFAPKFNDI